jgi:ABC-type Fe3+-hydroxamate transport system, periplasmic component
MRVVSLVPSATESLLALGVRPVACTRFCEQPDLLTVGGTKDPDLAAIRALAPDLVVVNDEENRRDDADALVAAGLSVHSMSPRSVQDVAPALATLATVLGVVPPTLEPPRARPNVGAAVTIIWRRPWMTQAGDTYGSSVLEHLGWSNPFADAEDRYPSVDLETIGQRSPDLVVLPSEPYAFSARHVPEIAAAMPRARVLLVDGRDLFWWGTRTPDALNRLVAALE